MSAQQPTVEAAWSPEEGAATVRELFSAAYSAEPQGVWAAPGRVNVIGEHVDYNGGQCLPIALPHRTFVVLAPRADDRVRLVSSMKPDVIWEGGLDQIVPGNVSGFPAYAGGPARILLDDGSALRGFDAAVASCVPLGSGLSSSAALECAVGVALNDVFGLGFGDDDAGRAAMARVCQRAENDVVGAPTGGLDQAASMRCREDHALLLDTLDGSVQQVPFDLAAEGLTLLVIDTRASHSLVDGQYGARRAACEAAAAILGVDFLRRISDADSLNESLAELSDPEQVKRVRHVVTEIARVEEFVKLLRAGRLTEVGPVMDASHESLRVDYEVTCPELDVAVSAARDAGALGARMTGGGFGGSAIALVPTHSVESVMAAVSKAFAENDFTPPGFLVATAAAPAGRVS